MKTYAPTVQCNSKTLNCVKCSKYPRLAVTHALSLNHHRSIAWSLTILSVNQTLPQIINMSHRMLTDPFL